MKSKLTLKGDWERNKGLYLLLIPVLAYYIIFNYIPMAGAVIAFQDFAPLKGIRGSDFVGWANFANFFDSYYFVRVVSNTLILSFLSLGVEFPAAIILALLINEIWSRRLASVVKTVSYLPHFISLVVVCGIVNDFTASGGVINDFLVRFGYNGASMLNRPEFFRPLYILSGLWQNMGWDSILFLAALTAIDPELYEAAHLDGANRWDQLWRITLPGIAPTIIVLFILRIGNLMNIGFEKVILLYNPVTYEKSDIIASFVYRKGLIDFDWGFSTAVGLFNSVINFVLLYGAHRASRKVNNTGLW